MIVGFTLSLLQVYMNVFQSRRDEDRSSGDLRWTFAAASAVYVFVLFTMSVRWDAAVSHTKRPLSHTSRLCHIMERQPISFLVLHVPVTVSGVLSLNGLLVASLLPAAVKHFVS